MKAQAIMAPNRVEHWNNHFFLKVFVDFAKLLKGCFGFCSATKGLFWILLSYFSRILPSFSRFYHVFSRFLPSFSRFYQVFQDFYIIRGYPSCLFQPLYRQTEE